MLGLTIMHYVLKCSKRWQSFTIPWHQFEYGALKRGTRKWLKWWHKYFYHAVFSADLSRSGQNEVQSGDYCSKYHINKWQVM